MRDLTDKPFGVNIAQAFVRDPGIAEFVIDQGVKFVTTSAGSPTQVTPSSSRRAGLTVFHVVPTLAAALKAVDAGVDGLVVEGGEGGGFKSPTAVATMVLLPLVRSKVDVPIIAAGGIVDGATMAAAFALGAEGVQMGTRMVSAAESPVHDNWKQAIVDAAETDTVFLNRPPLARAAGAAHRSARRRLDRRRAQRVRRFGDAQRLYFGGDMEAAIAARAARSPGASTRSARSPTSSRRFAKNSAAWCGTCGVIALADEAALGDAEQHRRIVRGLLDDLRQREQPLRMLIEQHQQRVLHERQARGRLEVGAPSRDRVRRMVRCDDVDAVLAPARAQRVAVGPVLIAGLHLIFVPSAAVALARTKGNACRPRR